MPESIFSAHCYQNLPHMCKSYNPCIFQNGSIAYIFTHTKISKFTVAHKTYSKLGLVQFMQVTITNQNWAWSVRFLKIINTFRKQYLSWTKLFEKLKKKWHLNFGRPSVDINFEMAHRTYSISVVLLFPIYRPFPCTMYLDLRWKQGRTKLSWYFLGAFRLHSPKTRIRSMLFCLSFRVRN